MSQLAKLFGLLGAANMAIAVGMGAFGAHGLKKRLSERMMEVYQTGVEYHVYHALGLFAVAFLAQQVESGLVRASGWMMVAGIVIFSGSLYVLSTTGIKWLGAITPIGGTLFIAAWISLAWAFFKA